MFHRADTGQTRALILALLALTLAFLSAAASVPAAERGSEVERLRQDHRSAERRELRLERRANKACARAGRSARRGKAGHGRGTRATRLCRRRRASERRAAARSERLRLRLVKAGTPSPGTSPASDRSYAGVAAVDRLAAPLLKVSGTSVTWARVGDVNRYVLATKLPGKATTYRYVTGTRVTPPVVPGSRVNYGLRTDVSGSRWAREVSITYPAPAPAPAPAPVPPPAPAPSPALKSFEVGVVSGADRLYEAKVAGKLGAKVARVEFKVGAPASELRGTIEAHAANGTRVVPLAGFHARMPTVAEARNLASWAREYGPGGTFWAGRSDGRLAMREIEFGNETSYGYQYGDQWDKPTYVARAREYALRLKDAHEAIRAVNPNVGLLGQAEDANTGSANWVNTMFDAVPDLGSRVSGWTIHPYGPRAKWEPRIDRLIKQTAARGASSSIPIWITEVGLATDGGTCLSDNYGWDRCMSFAAAASTLTTTVAEMRARFGTRLRALFLYQGRDQYRTGYSTSREHYFGALRHDMTDKGPYSGAVRTLLAGS